MTLQELNEQLSCFEEPIWLFDASKFPNGNDAYKEKSEVKEIELHEDSN